MIIEKKHFEYLVIQRGEVAHERDDFERWKAAYEASLEAIIQSIASVLPDRCEHIIDIGSGLGGIDILLAARYIPQPVVTLIDGLNDPPRVDWSFKTFSNAEVALDYQKKNGTKYPCYFAPGEWPQHTKKADLIVSFVAYGFHFAPNDYIDDVKRSMHAKTVLVLDIRQTRKDWLEDLVRAFGIPKVLERGKKHVRLAFNAP